MSLTSVLRTLTRPFHGHVPRSTSHLFSHGTTVLAHRGWSGVAPENTMAAFDLAAGLGVGFELDVGLTRDGALVVLHDDALDRTTTGTGWLDETLLHDVRALDAGAWHSPPFANEPVPLLRDVLKRHGGKVLIDIEIKSPRAGGPWSAKDLGFATADLITELGLIHQVFVSSFDPWVLHAVRRRTPGLIRGQLWYAPTDVPLRAKIEQLAIGQLALQHLARADLLGPQQVLWDAPHAAERRAQGYRLAAWTVNNVTDALRLDAIGVRTYITDHPDRLLQAFAS